MVAHLMINRGKYFHNQYAFISRKSSFPEFDLY